MKMPFAFITPHALRALALAAGLAALPVSAASIYVLTNDGKLATVPIDNPAAGGPAVTITGVTPGETIVAIDVRPQTQRLYALGVNHAADTATLYHLSPETGFAGVVGAASGIAYTTDGSTPVDLPDPATVSWDIDFNPAVDRLRIVAGSLNCRVNPNNGAPVDGNVGVSGINPDGAITGDTSTVSATAYTNSQPNNGNIATQYTLDAATDRLFVQNPPNNGTQVAGPALTLNGNPLDFTGAVGFDIEPFVNATASNLPVTAGSGYALLTVGGTTGLYQFSLVNGTAVLLGSISGRSIAIRPELGTAIALSASGTNLLRFSTAAPGTVTTQALGAPFTGETLAGLDFRPQTGQFYALGINPTDNNGTLYLVDPQTGTLTPVGGTSLIAYVDAMGNAVDLPDPATVGYGMDFNPTVDRLRIVAGNGLNCRVNPNNGLPIDGNAGVSGINPDGNINGTGVTGVDGTAYTNSYPQVLMTGPVTQYTIDSATNSLYIQNPPNAGTQSTPVAITLDGNPLDIASATGFDIPAPVSVASANTPAAGEGWLAASVSGTTGLYRLNLTTGAATLAGQIGTGTTPLAGLVVNTTASAQVEFPAGTTIYNGLTTIDFGVKAINGSTSQSVTLKNSGSQALAYTTALGIGAGYAVTNGASGTIAPGGTANLEVTFNPTLTGVFDDTLQIKTNDPAAAAFEILLTGTAIVPLGDDSITTTSGNSRLYVLANDGLSDTATITTVSDPAIQIDPTGRYLIIPAGYSGTFTYTTNDGGILGQGTVTVTAGAPVVGATVFNGLLYDFQNKVVGFASFKLKNGIATVAINAGTAKTSAKINLGSGAGSAFTPLGNLLVFNNNDGTYGLLLGALGGNVGGVLSAAVPTAPAAKHHIALASPNATFSGGGFAVVTTSSKGTIELKGTLPDGVKFSAATTLRDNGTYAFFSASAKGANPPAFVGGELLNASLATTDVTGQLEWRKLPQAPGTPGVHLVGLDTTLHANGSLYTGAALFSGSGTLVLSGGNLSGTETNPVTVTGGVPTVAGSLTAWTGVKAKKGLFKALVNVPGAAQPAKGSGIYLPKSNSAFGYFPGVSVGGRIQLTVP
jgi:hypothetical protein